MAVMKFTVSREHEITSETSHHLMEPKSCHFSLTLNVNINDLNVLGRVVKPCSGLFKISFFTQTRGEIIKLIPYLHIKHMATTICFKSTPKSMQQTMHYQFYVVFH